MKQRAIDLEEFERKFAADPDPWKTWSSSFEQMKRRNLRHMVGTGRHGRVLEVAAGNGSNTSMLASRALRLTATEGTASGAELTARAVSGVPRTTVLQLDLAMPFPGPRYDLIVISEVLYYLDARTLSVLANNVANTLQPGGALVLAHHTAFFDDAQRSGADIHDLFLRRIRLPLTPDRELRARRYRMIRARRPVG